MGCISYLHQPPSPSPLPCPSIHAPHPAVHAPAGLAGFQPGPYGPSGNNSDEPGHQAAQLPCERARGQGGAAALLPSPVAGGKADPAAQESLCS